MHNELSIYSVSKKLYEFLIEMLFKFYEEKRPFIRFISEIQRSSGQGHIFISILGT